ncbi:hypothetical protein BC941DRAFT_503866, partial [Chlamydoabsidia padenii]
MNILTKNRPRRIWKWVVFPSKSISHMKYGLEITITNKMTMMGKWQLNGNLDDCDWISNTTSLLSHMVDWVMTNKMIQT